jgi:hypothetical protein
MTEAEWLVCTDPTPMLDFLQGKGTVRKWRLCGVASCRRIWHFLPDEESRKAVESTELYADEAITNRQMAIVQSQVMGWRERHHFNPTIVNQRAAVVGQLAKLLARPTMRTKTVRAEMRQVIGAAFRMQALETPPEQRRRYMAERRVEQAALLRDIFGNPFRPVTLNPAWRTSNVTALAQSIYDEKAFDRLPILADALEDSGCDNQDVLNHCRQPGEHVRGCWVVDLVLGKE